MKSAHFITEQTTQKQKVLIVTEHTDVFVKELKSQLSAHDLRVFISPHIPEDTTQFELCFLIGHHNKIKKIDIQAKTIYIIFHPHKKNSRLPSAPKNSKLIHIVGDARYALTQMQTILWFAISTEDHSPILTLESPLQTQSTTREKKQPQLHFSLPPALIRLLLYLLIGCYLFAFWLPLAIASIYSYKSARLIQNNSFLEAQQINEQKKPYLSLATILFNPVRPLYLFFSLAQFPDDVFVINKTASELIHTAAELVGESKIFSSLVLQSNRTPSVAQETRLHFNSMQKLLNLAEDQILTIYRKIPPRVISKANKDEFQKNIAQLRKVKKVFSLLPVVLGENEEQTLLLLFANNMELRPGGGFIGSYGILKTQHFGLQDLTIFDVYDADGQLTAHVDPPRAIRDYLGQPHWYLRDSAFFPDFYDTYQQATYFLQKEMGLSSWNGSLLITTSAVKDIIGAYGELLLPDYNERITKDNFYIKTQYEVENNFFPGSSQKKNFLSAIVKQLSSQTEAVNPLLLGTAIVDGFDQKNIVLFMNNEKVQKHLDELFWSGRLATPFCPPSIHDNCYADFQFPLDANLGVNKTNFFIDKRYEVATAIEESGLITTKLSIHYSNNSLSNVFPGGTYKNYFQVVLPADSVVSAIQMDGQQVTSYDSETGKQKTIGFLIEVPPQSKKIIEIRYTSSIKLKKGKAAYQLVLQKQIGALKHDVVFSLSLPSNMNLINTNFSPLVKNNLILYNTDLSTDRVFFIELLKNDL